MAHEFPTKAKVVVIGAGAIGCSTAWHLAKRGWDDIVVIDKSKITSGTTWHAAGLIGTARMSDTLAKLAGYCLDFINIIEDETGMSTGFNQVGSLWTADDPERFEEIRRLHDVTKIWGPETHLLTPDEIEGLYPIIAKKGLIGGMYAPGEGWASPVDFTMAIAKGVRQHGGRIFEDTAVTGVKVENGAIAGVETDKGFVETTIVANCAGLWAREIAAMAGADVPLYPCEHYYVVTEKSDQIPPGLPVMRDQSHEAYYKEDAGSILLGAFEKKARPVDPGDLPKGFSFGELPGAMDHFMPVLEMAIDRVPLIGELGWELHMDAEFAPHVFEVLEEAGRKFDLKLCGLHALDSCRIEKGYRHFGHEVSQDETPFDAGLGFVCNFDHGDFIGHNAALAAKAAPRLKRLVMVKLRDSEPMLYGHEPLLRNDKVVGYVTSGGYGHAVGASVGQAWVKNGDGTTPDYIKAGEYSVLIANEEFAVDVSLRAFYDPASERVRM